MELCGIKFTRKDFLNLAAIIGSSFLYSLGMNTFVKSANLFPGGFAGISRLSSMLLDDYAHITVSFSIIYWILNAVTTAAVWKRIGHKFVLYSVLWFTMTSLFTSIIPIREITEDILLMSVFGGCINGIALGIALKFNASSGGTDFIAIDFSNHFHKPAWNYLFIVNAFVLVIAGYCYGWNQALYSIIFQYVSKEIVNAMHLRYKYSRLQVVTDQPEAISEAVFRHIRHGITKLDCQGEYSHMPHSLLMITVNTYQLPEIMEIIQSVDPKAFIAVSEVSKVVGNYYQKPLE